MSNFTDKDSANKGRKPAVFSVGDEPIAATANPRRPQSFTTDYEVTAQENDPFDAANLEDLSDPTIAEPRQDKRFSFGKLALGALGILFSFAFGLWADQLIRDLFNRADWLGYSALAVLGVALFSIFVVVIREVLGLMRINAVQDLKADSAAAMNERSKPHAQSVTTKLSAIVAHRPETAQGRDRLKSYQDDVIDGPQLLEIAEKELLSPLDRQARTLILNASKRVSVVTAISPRAIVDMAYVLFEVSRLVRSMAELYGGRPGTLGLIKLMRDVFAHLAVTGSIAVGDSIIQQVLGHGLATKLSARLGEGVINGLLTARIGIAAMDLCRPMPFTTLKRPGIGDFISDLGPNLTGKA